MASVQERLQINPVSMDKWSKREQLCLASAVSCNGDKNWANVSRSLKIVCGANRPADWFSLKSCALQYEELLENADSAKKNKPGVGEVAEVSSAAAGNNSLDVVLRRLKEERVQELKAEIRREQEEYAKIYAELKAVQSGQLTEEEITEMWKEIEKEQEMHRIDEMKLENQLREREQNKQDMQRNWRANAGATLTTGYGSQKPEDNLQDIIGSNKSTTTGTQQPQATSPLLTSLLKSPTPGSASAALGNTAHVTSPTITTLLTGGAITQNQPAITLKNSIPANEAAQLLTRPISGPPMESLSNISSGTQNLLSPSQSAPTLSMLLEKSKVPMPSSKAVTGHATTTSSSSIAPLELLKEIKLASLTSDSNNEEVPMDIEEDVVASTSCSGDLLDVDDSDADANEEQQLLEVFKNIGTIDELEDIDVAAVINEEEDFLKSVGEEPVDETEDIDFEEQSVQQSKNLEHEQIPPGKNTNSIKNAEKKLSELSSHKNDTKVETISSDDSNDNIPLATLGSNNSFDSKDVGKVMGHKEKFDKELHEHLSKGKDSNILDQTGNDDDSSQSENSKDLKELKNIAPLKSPGSESSEVIIIPTDDESSGDKQATEQVDGDKQQVGDDVDAMDDDITESTARKDMNPNMSLDALDEASNSTALKSKDFTQEAPTTISLADSDDDSSETTDISAKIDEKMLTLEKLSAQLKRSSEEPKAEVAKLLDEDSALSQTPVKPQAIRKLRDRDRSESPMPTLDDDTTTASDHSVTQRLRRRYSSTPLIDSIPNSPALSDRDDRDLKTSKKYLLGLYNALMSSKNAAALQHAHNEHAAKFKHICNRCIDFQLIKKNIETGTIRSVYELQRDVLLLCQNAIMVFETNSLDYKLVSEFIKDCQNIKEFMSNGNKMVALKIEKDNKETRTSTSSSHSSGVKVRGSSRKSLRIT